MCTHLTFELKNILISNEDLDINYLCECIESEIGLYPSGYLKDLHKLSFVFNESLNSREVKKIKEIVKNWNYE